MADEVYLQLVVTVRRRLSVCFFQTYTSGLSSYCFCNFVFTRDYEIPGNYVQVRTYSLRVERFHSTPSQLQLAFGGKRLEVQVGLFCSSSSSSSLTSFPTTPPFGGTNYLKVDYV